MQPPHNWNYMHLYYISVRTTLVEPGPVVTEFERKVYEEAEKMDLSGADEETAKIFREIYLPYSKKVFASLGQTPEEVAEASDDNYVSVWVQRIPKNTCFCPLQCWNMFLFLWCSKLWKWSQPRSLPCVTRPTGCTCPWLHWSTQIRLVDCLWTPSIRWSLNMTMCSMPLWECCACCRGGQGRSNDLTAP